MWRENGYRDLWLLVVSVVALAAIVIGNHENQHRIDDIQRERVFRGQETLRNTAALCALRDNLERRGQQSVAFLAAHPHGVQGISTAVIVKGIRDTRQTLRALSGIKC